MIVGRWQGEESAAPGLPRAGHAPWSLLLLCLFLLGWFPTPARAHEVRPAYLQLRQTNAETYDVLWKVPARGDDMRLALDVEFPASCEDVTPPRGEFAAGSFIEQWTVSCPAGLSGETMRIAGLAATMTDVLVRLERLDGVAQIVRLTPAAPSFVVEAAASRLQVATTYMGLGVEHILLGVDHLLFVLALLILVEGARRLILTVTAFTVAHSISLAAATLGFVHVPGPPVEACIALSIVFVAAEIVRSHGGRPSLTARAPWLVAFSFGLLHGLGFAGALADVGLPQHAIPIALLFFNVGVEIGQVAFVAAALIIVALGRHLPLTPPSWSWRVIPYSIGSVAAFWLIQRLAAF